MSGSQTFVLRISERWHIFQYLNNSIISFNIWLEIEGSFFDFFNVATRDNFKVFFGLLVNLSFRPLFNIYKKSLVKTEN